MAGSQRGIGAGMLIALVSAAAFGVAGPLAKSLLESGWTSGGAVLVRVAGGAAVLLVPTVVLATRNSGRVVRRHWGLLVAYGSVAVAGVMIGFFSAVRTLPVGVALLIEYIAPVLVVGWLWARRGQRPGARTAVGGIVAMVGLVAVLDPGAGGGLDAAGVAWALFAALCLAGYFVLSAHAGDEVPPVLTIGAGMVVATGVVAVAAAVGLLPVVVSSAETSLAGHPVPWWVPAAGLVLICSVFSYLTGIVAVRTLGSRLASFVALTEVIFAVVAAWLMLAELPSGRQLIGGLLIVAGLVLVRLGEPALSHER